MLDEDRNKMFAEAIDVILEIWSRERPDDIDLPDNRFKVAINAHTALDSAPAARKSRSRSRGRRSSAPWWCRSRPVGADGKRDFHPLSANFLLAKHLKSHWQNSPQGKTEVGAEGRDEGLAHGAQHLRRRRRQDRRAYGGEDGARIGSISSR